jgi:hypothetical protein
VELRAARVAPDADWEVLSADDPGARNGFPTPDAIAPRRERIGAGPRFSVLVPARSVSVITLTVRQR